MKDVREALTGDLGTMLDHQHGDSGFCKNLGREDVHWIKPDL